MQHPLFHQRTKQRTRLANYCNLRVDTMNILGIKFALDGSFRADNSNTLISGIFYRTFGSRFHHANHRNIQFCLNGIQRKGAGCITGNHNRLYIFCLQKTYNLPGISDNRIFGLTSIRYSCGIAKIYNAFSWQLSVDFPCHSQSAYAGIKHPDWCIICFLHKNHPSFRLFILPLFQ